MAEKGVFGALTVYVSLAPGSSVTHFGSTQHKGKVPLTPEKEGRKAVSWDSKTHWFQRCHIWNGTPVSGALILFVHVKTWLPASKKKKAQRDS